MVPSAHGPPSSRNRRNWLRPQSLTNTRRIGFFAAGLALYWGLAAFVPSLAGENIMRLTPFFVGAAGYFLGVVAGIAAGALAIIAHTVLWNLAGYPGWAVTWEVQPAVHLGILLLGPVLGYLGTLLVRLQDETSRRESTEAALSESESRFREVVENIDEVFWIGTADLGRMVYINPAFEGIFRRSRDQMYDNPLTVIDFVVPEDRELVKSAFVKSASEGLDLEFRIRWPDGQLRWIHSRFFPVKGPAGTTLRITGVCTDITEQKTAEAAVKSSESKYRLLVEQLPAVVYIQQLDPTRPVLYVSPQIESILGFTQKEWMQNPRKFYQQWHPEDRDRVMRELAICFGNRGRFVCDYRMVTESGETRWFHDVGDIVENEYGEALYQQGVLLDITELKNAEWALRESEERLRILVESAPDLIFEIDAQGRFLTMNAAGLRTLAIGDGPNIRGRRFLDFVHENDHELVAGKLTGTFAGEVFDFEYRDAGPAVPRVFSASFVPLKGSDGTVDRLIGYSRDITERKSAEQALRASEDRYRRFFEDDLSGYFIAASDGSLTTCNPAFVRMFGYEARGEALSVNLKDLFPTTESRDEFLEHLVNETKLVNYEVELRGKNGKTVHLIANIVGGFDDEGAITEIKGYFYDNTQRKKLEEQLRQAQKMEAMGRLAGGIAHDFNNSLTSILGYNELLLNKLETGSPLSRYSREVMKAADRAAALTKRLLAFSRKQVIKPKAINVNSIVGNMEKVLRRTIGEDITLVTVTNMSAGKIKVDPGLIETAILNLAINARDAMPEGGKLTLETEDLTINFSNGRLYPGIEHGRYAVIKVSDTGVGIDGDTQSKIFEPFFTTKEHGRGTGLGLSTVYGVVKQSGGYVRVLSESGKGAIFVLFFPVVEDVFLSSAARQVYLGPSRGSETVLLAEDEPVVQKLIKDVLEAKGYRILKASDGEEALKVFTKHHGRVDLLITDLVMPRMHGRELADRLKAQNPGMKVLYISGYIGDANVKIGELDAGTSFLSKPFSPGALARKVRLLLDAEGFTRRPAPKMVSPTGTGLDHKPSSSPNV